MTDPHSPNQSSCVVVPRASTADTCATRLYAAGAGEVSTWPNGRGSCHLVGWFDDITSSTGAVADFRRLGDRAVLGPMSRGAWLAWQRHVAPVSYADRCCLCYPWSTVDPDQFDEIIEIDPGNGFGTGAHPSTQLALEEMTSHDLTDKRLLDVGCGSGILSVVAARRGSRVTAIDIEEQAVSAARDNAALNHVDHMVDASLTPLAEVSSEFDMICANIHAHVLVEIGPQLRALLADQGSLIISGISRAQVSTLERRLEPLVMVGRRQRDDWVSLRFSKT